MTSSSNNNKNSSTEKVTSHSLSSLLSASTFIFVCRISGAGLAFLTQLLLARWMGAYELGIYIYAFSWMIIISTIIGIGYDSASFRVIGKALSESRFDLIRGFVIRGRQILISLGLLSVLLLGSILMMSDGIVDADSKNTLLIALITVPVYLMAVFHEAVSHAFSWFAMMVLPNIVIRPLILLIIVSVIWFTTGELNSETVMSYQLLAMLMVVLVHYFLFRIKLTKAIGNPQPAFMTRSWVRIGLPQLIPMLFIGYLAEINVVIVGFFLPADQVAIFSIAFRVAMLITFMIYAVDSIFRPKAALLYADQNMPELQKITSHSTQLMFWPGLCCIILFVLSGKFILGVFGEEFIAGYEVFALLALSQLITVSTGPVNTLLTVTGHQDYSLMVFGTALIVLIILNVILIPIFGMAGAAYAVIIVTAFWNIWMLALVKKHLKIHPTVLSFAHKYK